MIGEMMNVPDKWTVLLTGDNNGLLGEFGCKFDGSPSTYDRVDVQRIAAPVAAPAPSELTNEQIKQIVSAGIHAGKLSWVGYEADADGKFTIPMLSRVHYQLARLVAATVLAPVSP